VNVICEPCPCLASCVPLWRGLCDVCALLRQHVARLSSMDHSVYSAQPTRCVWCARTDSGGSRLPPAPRPTRAEVSGALVFAHPRRWKLRAFGSCSRARNLAGWLGRAVHERKTTHMGRQRRQEPSVGGLEACLGWPETSRSVSLGFGAVRLLLRGPCTASCPTRTARTCT